MDFEVTEISNLPACPCGKKNAPAWIITCPVHGDPRLKERFPKRNVRLNNYVVSVKRERYQILSRGAHRFVLIDPNDGHPVFVWIRRKVKSYRGNPLKGLTKYEQFMFKLMRDKLGLDCRIM